MKQTKSILYYFLIVLYIILYSCQKEDEKGIVWSENMVINNETMGNLHNKIPESKRDGIINLKITGYINTVDFEFLNSLIKSYTLKKLDISEAHIFEAIIPDYAFAGCYNLEEIILPKSDIETIGIRAFYSCSNLKSIILPEQTKHIKESAFEFCSLLNIIEMPSKVETIEKKAFWYCRSLTRLEIPENIRKIDEYTFGDCIALKEITIPKGITKIEGTAFLNCKSLEKLFFENSNLVIDLGHEYNFNYLFECPIKEVYVGRNIPLKLFSNNDSVEKVTIGGNVSFIDNWAFYCKNLKEVIIGNNVYGIGEYSFISNSLNSIKLSDNLQTIGNMSFNETNVQEIHFPTTLTKIGDYVFEESPNLKKIYLYGLTPPSVGKGSFKDALNNNCELYVPLKSLELYKNDTFWKSFTKISPM